MPAFAGLARGWVVPRGAGSVVLSQFLGSHSMCLHSPHNIYVEVPIKYTIRYNELKSVAAHGQHIALYCSFCDNKEAAG